MEREASLDDPEAWSAAVEAADAAALTVVIAHRLGPTLRRHVAPEDVLQEALFKAWQSRGSFVKRDATSFRHWLLSIAVHCVEDHRDAAGAAKRGGGRTKAWTDAVGEDDGGACLDPWTSTTPSRVAAARERAGAMLRSLESLPDDLREVVRLRLFEDQRIEDVAARLGLGPEAVRHRFRKGAALYRERLRAALGASTTQGD